MSDDDTVAGDDIMDALDEDVDAEQLGSGRGESSSGALQSKRKPRGRNKRRWALDGPEPMAFDRHGSAVTEKSHSRLNRYIAEVGRDFPLHIHNWKLMGKDLLKFAWERVEERILWTTEQEGIKSKVRDFSPPS